MLMVPNDAQLKKWLEDVLSGHKQHLSKKKKQACTPDIYCDMGEKSHTSGESSDTWFFLAQTTLFS